MECVRNVQKGHGIRVSTGRIIGDKYYGHYYSSYGLCTYLNY